jgi:hypothetical protein
MLGTPVIAFSPVEQPEPVAIPLFFIRYCAPNPLLHLCAGSCLAPEFQSRPDALRALPDPRQAPMSGTTAGVDKSGINTLPIVADAQSQFCVVVSNVYFNPGGSRMVEGISNHFMANPIDFVLERRRKPSWFTLDNHPFN